MAVATRRSPLRASDYIPVVAHVDETVLRTKNGDLVAVIQLAGLCVETQPDEAQAWYKTLCAQVYNTLASADYALYFHTLNRPDTYHPAGAFPPGFADTLNQAYAAQDASRAQYRLQFYLTIVRRSQGAKVKPAGFVSALARKTHQQALTAWQTQAKKDLHASVARLTQTLAPYGPTVLGLHDTPQGVVSAPLAFYHYLINASWRPIRLAKVDYATYLPSSRLFFAHRIIKIEGASQCRYGAILAIKQYCATTMHGQLDNLASIQAEFSLTQCFMPSHKLALQKAMAQQQYRLTSSEDAALTQIDAISAAQDMLASSEAAFGEHSLSLLCLADSVEALERNVAKLEGALIEAGIHPIREDLNLELAYFSQLPGNMAMIARKAPIHTLNLAAFNSFHCAFMGNRQGNPWGPPVTVLQGQTGNRIALNWHVGKVGNTLIIGKTGSGKSLVTNVLLAQSMKYWDKGLRLFYFDYKRGNEAFVRALGGTYINIGRPAHRLNPLQMPDTPENRTGLQTWLALLLNEGLALSHATHQHITEAIATNFANAPCHRHLRELEPSVASIDNPRPLAAWYGDGSESRYFGGIEDTLTFDSRIMGMDMTEVLGCARALPAVTYALLLRIQHVMRTHPGEPFIIVMDEGWALLRSPAFRQILEQWLVTIRRAGGLLVFLTQNIDHLMQYPELTQVILNNTATKLFFPQQEADKHIYCELCKLTPQEYHLIRTTPASSHYFLLKQDGMSSLAKVPLESTALRQLIPVLSGTDSSVAVLDALRAKHGDNPQAWLSPFLDRLQT